MRRVYILTGVMPVHAGVSTNANAMQFERSTDDTATEIYPMVTKLFLTLLVK